MSKILITGAAGFVGWNLSLYLRSNGYEVIMLDVDDRLERIQYYQQISAQAADAEISLIRTDLTRGSMDVPEDLAAIIHLAALPHVDYSYYYPTQVHHNNVSSTASLLEHAAAHGIPFILASSVEVYGGEQPVPYKETDPCHPMSPYAASKVACEVLLHTYMRCFGLKGKIFRLTNLYGPWQAPDRIIPRNICRICNQEELDIQSNVTRDFLYVDDAVRAIALILEQAPYGEIYNISSGKGTSMSEVGEELMKLAGAGRNLSVRRFEREFTNARGASLVIDSQKLRSLGWQPEIGLSEGLARTMRWYEEHRAWSSRFREQYIIERHDQRFIVDAARQLPGSSPLKEQQQPLVSKIG